MSLLSILGIFTCGHDYTDLSPEEFSHIIESGEVALVDIRTPDEYAAGHLPGAVNFDWYASGFMEKMLETYPKDTPLAIYCRSGKRSAAAAAKLSKVGYRVYNMLGGIIAWAEEKRTVTRRVKN